MRTILISLTLTVGCTREQRFVPLTDLGVSDSARPSTDLSRADLSFKPGWNQTIVTSGLRLNAVWASGPTDIYAVGLSGTIFHSSGDDVWTEQKTGRPFELTAVFGSSDHDVYAVESGAVLHTTGDGHWSVLPNIPADGFSRLQLVWMASANNVYFAGDTGQSVPANLTGGVNITRWNQQNLTSEFAAAEHSILGFWGTDPTDLWAVGGFADGGSTSALVLHSTGDGSWTQQNFEPDKGLLFQGLLTAAWSSSTTNIYAAVGHNNISGNSGIFRCNGAGTAWQRETDKMNPPEIYGMWGSGPTDVWAVGLAIDGPNYNGLVLRSQGDGHWAADPDLTAAELQEFPLYGVWGSRFGDVYLVGQAGVIFHKRE